MGRGRGREKERKMEMKRVGRFDFFLNEVHGCKLGSRKPAVHVAVDSNCNIAYVGCTCVARNTCGA